MWLHDVDMGFYVFPNQLFLTNYNQRNPAVQQINDEDIESVIDGLILHPAVRLPLILNKGHPQGEHLLRNQGFLNVRKRQTMIPRCLPFIKHPPGFVIESRRPVFPDIVG